MSDFPTSEAFLAEPNVAVLATVDAKGNPHAAPVWFIYDGRTIVVSTTRSSKKFANILANPAVTLVVDRRTLPYYAVIVRGTAAPGAGLTDEELLRVSIHYYGAELGREYASRARAENEVTIVVTPRRIIEAKGDTGRTS